MSLLHEVCERGNPYELSSLLLITRTSINFQNREGETPLQIACKHGHMGTIKILTSRAECNLNISDEKGNTPLHTACKHGRHSTVEFLVADQRCQLDTKNSELNTPLHIACHTKQLRIIRLLLDMKCSTNIPNTKGETAEDIALNENGDCLLHIACQLGDVAMVRHLIIDQRCNPNISNATSNTPLHIACKHVHHSIVELLVADQRCQLDTKNSELNTPLHIALHTKEFRIIRLLLDRKCNTNIPNAKGETAEDIPLNENGDCLLHIACQWGDVAMVRHLIIGQRCNPNIRNATSNTPLHVASKHDHVDVVKAFLSRKDCDPNISDEEGNTPLHTACEYGHHSIVESIVSDQRCQFNSRNREGRTPLNIASEQGHLYTVKAVMSCKACDPNISDEKGNTPLHTACKYGHHSIVKFLVGDQRCQLDTKNCELNTPLHIACHTKQLRIIRLLLDRKCSTGIQNTKGETAEDIPLNENRDFLLHIACQWGDAAIVRHLVIDQRCNPNITNATSNTPLHIASRHGHVDVVKVVLKRKDCNLNVSDKNGNTPLHTACKHRHHSIIKFLVADRRCQLDAKNSELNTPLHIACNTKQFQTVRLLLYRKCSTNIPNAKGETAEDIAFNENGDRLLHIACQWGDVAIVRHLVIGHRYNITNAACNTSLHIASKHGHMNVDKVVLSRKDCDLNISDEKGNTPLHTACKYGHHSTVELLVADQRCQLDTKNSELNTPLHIACHTKQLRIIRLLLERKCSTNIPNAKGETAEYIPLNENGDCLLHIACQWGDVAIVRNLIVDQRCNPNIANNLKYTPLHAASQHGNLDVVEVLVSRKDCGLNISDERGNTPLHLACHIKALSIVKLLYGKGCSTSIPNKIGETAGDIPLNENGDCLLHIACQWGDVAMVKNLIIADERCQLDTKNSKLSTPLHIACHRKELSIIRLLLDRKCSIKIPDKNGETAEDIALNENGDYLLHIACQWGDVSIVRHLIIDQRCDINITNAFGNAPLHIASKHGHVDVVKLVFSRTDCDPNISNIKGDTPLHTACMHGHHSTVEFLVSDQRCQLNAKNGEGNTPLHIACHIKALSIIRLLLQRKCSTSIPNKKGEIAEGIPLNDDKDFLLHVACLWGDVDIVRYLVTDQTCDPNTLNKYHLTPLLAAINHGKPSVATALLQHAKCDLNLRDQAGNTALHLACISGQTDPEMVKVAKKLIISVDPLCVNNAGQTPIELTTNYELIQSISHFTKCKTKHSVQTYINLFIVGNPETGKSSLVKAICKEANVLWKVVPKVLRRVKNVPPHTAGIIPTTFQSKTFGNTVLYDLAGQTEYYTSHAAVIQATVISTPPAFVIVVNLSDSEKKANQTLRYWWSFINNHAVRSSAPPQVILVGSHADKVKGSVREKVSQMSALLKYLPTSFVFAGQVALDCRDPASSELRLFSSLVNHSCVELRKTADVDLHCHVLYAYLLDKFPGKVACTVSDITTSIQESDALLPQNSDLLIPLIASLSDKGLLLLVKESGSCEDSWVILQKQVLIAEINGTIFAPKGFSQHKDLSSSTGVVPSRKLKYEFSHYNPIMIAKFLLHLEFCFKINDHEALELLKDDNLREENMPQSLSEEYYFFPALVSIENPLQIWQQDEDMICQCGWLYQCIRHDQFLTTQFLHVLILRLAFSFALQFDPGDSHDNSLVLHRRCSVWKRGIGWLTRVPIETVVEVGLLNQSVIVMMRCPKGEEAKCAQLRSEITQKVLQARDEHCKAVKMSESFIHPDDVKYPFIENTEDYKRYTLNEIARATIKEAGNVLDYRGRNPFPMKNLLLFDPYSDASTELLSELFSEKHSLGEQVRGKVLHKATPQTSPSQETAQENSIFICEEPHSSQLTMSQERGPTLDGVPLHSIPHPTIRGKVGGATQVLTHDISQHSIKPALPDLLKFTCTDGRVINIPVEVGTKYVHFGTFLLNDRNGSRVKIMARKHHYDAEQINIEILQEWLTGRGKQPVTWATLVEVLHDIELCTLAGDISTSRCPSNKCSSEQ